MSAGFSRQPHALAMQRILITGISGFVGGHFAHYVAQKRPGFIIHGASRRNPRWNFLPIELRGQIIFHQIDLLDRDKTSQLLEEIKPDYILHLAAFSSVALSWTQPVECFLNNTNIFLNLVDAVRYQKINCKILSVGSSEEYGIVTEEDLPLKEDSKTMPTSPYAVARVAQENLALIYSRGFQRNLCCTRSFNHIGPGQSDRFVVSSIVKQFAEIKLKKKAPVIRLGDGSIVRDFIDIQDVVTAYDALLENGRAGEIYNICSGKGHKILDVVRVMSEISGVDVRVEHDDSLLRPIDNPILIGSNDKIMKEVCWRPQVKLDASLEKMYEYWSNQILMRS